MKILAFTRPHVVPNLYEETHHFFFLEAQLFVHTDIDVLLSFHVIDSYH